MAMALTDPSNPEQGTSGNQSTIPSPRQGNGRLVATLYARNCVVLMALLVLLSFGTSTFKSNVHAAEQVVKLDDNGDVTVQSPQAKINEEARAEILTLELKEDTRTRQRKQMRKRPHRMIKNHHPENIAEADPRRRLMGRSRGGRYGRGGYSMMSMSRSYRSGRSFFRTFNPTQTPSASPSRAPAGEPSARPSAQPSVAPSALPSEGPTLAPTASVAPSDQPSLQPSTSPSVSFSPTTSPAPSDSPSLSVQPSSLPSNAPTNPPTVSTAPSSTPSKAPSATPSGAPSRTPSQAPSFPRRTFMPTLAPTEPRGTAFPTFERSRSRSRSGMMSRSSMRGMGMMGRGRSFNSLDQEEFDNQLEEIIAFLPQDFLALFGNN